MFQSFEDCSLSFSVFFDFLILEIETERRHCKNIHLLYSILNVQNFVVGLQSNHQHKNEADSKLLRANIRSPLQSIDSRDTGGSRVISCTSRFEDDSGCLLCLSSLL